MTTNKGKNKIIIAALAGLAVTLICAGLFDMSLLVSLVLGAIVYVALSRRGSADTAQDDSADAPSPEPPAPVQADTPEPVQNVAETPEIEDGDPIVADTAEPTEPDAAPAVANVRLGTILPGEAEIANTKGSWRYQG